MPTETISNTQPMELSAPEKLNDFHVLSGFECGETSIDQYLHKEARASQKKGHAAVYVACEQGTRNVMAFYTLSNGSVAREEVPKSRQRNSPSRHSITLLGRMGVSKAAQGSGVATAILKDAIIRSLNAAEVIGSSALIVHPLNDRLAKFYREKAGFIPCPTLSPVTLMLPLK